MIWCLHGAVGMASDWNDFSARMAMAGHEVRAVDLWEFADGRGCSLAEFGEALCREVEREDEEPVLVGYSLGGRLGLHALLAKPSLWKAAVIASAHPGIGGEEDRVLRMAEDARWAAHALTGEWEAFLERWNTQGILRRSLGPGLADRGDLESRREAVARGFMEWSLGKQDDLRPRLGEVPCPVLWMTGAEDEKFRALAEEAVACLPDAWHCIVASAGHRVVWDAAEHVAEEIERFLVQRGCSPRESRE